MKLRGEPTVVKRGERGRDLMDGGCLGLPGGLASGLASETGRETDEGPPGLLGWYLAAAYVQ